MSVGVCGVPQGESASACMASPHDRSGSTPGQNGCGGSGESPLSSGGPDTARRRPFGFRTVLQPLHYYHTMLRSPQHGSWLLARARYLSWPRQRWRPKSVSSTATARSSSSSVPHTRKVSARRPQNDDERLTTNKLLITNTTLLLSAGTPGDNTTTCPGSSRRHRAKREQ